MSILRMARRALTYQTIFSTDRDMSSVGPSGQSVTPESALTLSAVWASTRLLTNTVATLPMAAYRRVNGQRVPIARPAWLDAPLPRDPNYTRTVLMTQVMTSLLMDGNAFILTAPNTLDPQALYVLNPRHVDIKGGLDTEPRFVVRTDNGMVEFGPAEVLHIPYITLPGERRGYDPIKAYRLAVGHGLAVEEFGSKFFGEGATMSGVIEVPGPAPAQEVIDQLRTDFKARNSGRRNSHAVGILTGGMKFTPLSIAPDNAQFIETARWTAEQVAMVFGVPPHMIGLTEANSAYASVEQKATEFVEFSVRPYLERIEAGFTRLMGEPSAFVKFNIDGLLRGDQKTRYEAYNAGIDGGYLVFNDIRRLEDLPPLPDGDRQRVKLDHSDAEIARLRERVDVANGLVMTGYDPAAAAALVGLNIKHLGLPPQTMQPVNIVDEEKDSDGTPQDA